MHSLWELLGSKKEIREIHHHPQKTIARFEEVLDKSFIFIFSRNPWDRFISSFFYSVKRYNPNKPHSIRKVCFNFKEDVNLFINKMKDSKKFEKKVIKSFHFRPQVNWLYKKIDFYGKYETLERDFKKVSRIIKPGSKNIELKSLNISENRNRELPYQSYFSEENIKYIGELYKEDIDYFNYTFNN
jgi:hypothetical protein